MIDKLKQHEKAWTEFVEWVSKQDYYEYVKIEHENMVTSYIGKTEINYKIFNPPIKISDRELRSLLIEFLDSKGWIITSSWYFDGSESYKGTFEYELWCFPDDHCCRFTSNGYSNRDDGLEEVIIKAFEIYNNQLNQRGEK